MRVSKADGSQATDLQRDALIAAGVDPVHLYEDLASGKREDRPGLAACVKALRGSLGRVAVFFASLWLKLPGYIKRL
nr:putative resolvase [uncultured bacterium]